MFIRIFAFQTSTKSSIMKKSILMLAAVATFGQAKSQNWTIDNAHSQVMFTVSHLVISEVTGNFKNFKGSFTATESDFADAAINFSIDVNSINTENEMRDKHLKSDDFFNAEKYPTIAFKGKGLKKISSNKYQLAGNITIREVTRPVVLDVTYSGTAKDGYGNTKAGFKIKGVVSRKDYNLKWNAMTEAGGAVVGDEVEFVSNLQLTRSN